MVKRCFHFVQCKCYFFYDGWRKHSKLQICWLLKFYVKNLLYKNYFSYILCYTESLSGAQMWKHNPYCSCTCKLVFFLAVLIVSYVGIRSLKGQNGDKCFDMRACPLVVFICICFTCKTCLWWLFHHLKALFKWLKLWKKLVIWTRGLLCQTTPGSRVNFELNEKASRNEKG